MRRVSVLLSILVTILIGGVAAGWAGSPTLAQEGTPSAEDFVAPEGITFVPVAFGTADELPAAPAEIGVVRFVVEPGAVFPIDASDPSVTLVSVESGALTSQVDVAITVTRAATYTAFATPDADMSAIPPPEEIAADTEFTLEVGDSAYYPGSISGEVRNDGQEPTVVLLVFIDPLDGGTMGTPAP